MEVRKIVRRIVILLVIIFVIFIQRSLSDESEQMRMINSYKKAIEQHTDSNIDEQCKSIDEVLKIYEDLKDKNAFNIIPTTISDTFKSLSTRKEELIKMKHAIKELKDGILSFEKNISHEKANNKDENEEVAENIKDKVHKFAEEVKKNTENIENAQAVTQVEIETLKNFIAGTEEKKSDAESNAKNNDDL
ncbi:hypothetical protein NEMIN01_0129 [Nematocida minor]|uniref:uncharacterized protein n=1 Tax=Nematocida minor TaxID=1912983 RepID=UPI00221F899A|nr:uncharacterized protein NEMIN01_0025 [Nematocida minor]XP_051332031.1 uncharacterized protein NEMIN01_0129 [Nematocida minor]KAI5188761.1 hypothetical protein NEMIN01_0025 [Nematocida minor]KAI5188865.1 hypothetical protein NEMIN01_0129 [Nematocida minor]